MARAETDLRRCQASGYRDQYGYYHQPDCSRQAYLLERARVYLRECEDRLRTAQAWRSRIEQAAHQFQRTENRLNDVATSHTERARTFLERVGAGYAAVQAAAGIVGGALIAAAVLGLAGAAVKALGTATGRAYRVRGRLGEELAQAVALHELGLHEQQILAQGTADTPVLATVINDDTGQADIYLRLDADAEQWTPLDRDVPVGGEP